MPSLEEIMGSASGPLHDALAAGLADITQQQSVNFSLYTRYVLPLDGFVFWIRTGEFSAMGSLHWLTDRRQNEDETAAYNSIVFTTAGPLTDLNEVDTNTLIVGTIGGIRYGFTREGWHFPQASIWHYAGDALKAAETTQLIDHPTQLDPTQLIVSNSLPAWLTLFSYRPIWLTPLNPAIPLYPSFLVPDNLEPPYGSVHIEPASTVALQSAPWLNNDSSHYQLTAEDVRITLYGCGNSAALDFLDLINRYSYDQNTIGIMSMPTVRDGKRAMPEAMTLAQQKFIDVRVSYVQTRINDLARQLIETAQATVLTPVMYEPVSLIFPALNVAVDADVLSATERYVSSLLSGAASVSTAAGVLTARPLIEMDALSTVQAAPGALAVTASSLPGIAQVLPQLGIKLGVAGAPAATVAVQVTAGGLIGQSVGIAPAAAVSASVVPSVNPLASPISAVAGVSVSATREVLFAEAMAAVASVNVSAMALRPTSARIAAAAVQTVAPAVVIEVGSALGAGLVATTGVQVSPGVIYTAESDTVATVRSTAIEILAAPVQAIGATAGVSLGLAVKAPVQSAIPTAFSVTLSPRETQAVVPPVFAAISTVAVSASTLPTAGMGIAAASGVIAVAGVMLAAAPAVVATAASATSVANLAEAIRPVVAAVVVTIARPGAQDQAQAALAAVTQIAAHAAVPSQTTGLDAGVATASTLYHAATNADYAEGNGTSLATFTTT